jgi:hypothetical protein
MHRVTPFSDVRQPDEIGNVPDTASQLEASLRPESVVAVPDQTRFNYLFPALQKDPAALLPTSANTVQALKDLGSTMREPGTDAALDSDIPSAYSYFGQFVDHDITLMKMRNVNLNDPNLTPLPPAEIGNIRNLRSPWLDLDSLYSDAPHVSDDLLLVGKVFDDNRLPPGKPDRFFDLPRVGGSKDPAHDRAPRIGDRRDEETTILGQLHVAFLRAHNAIVEGGYDHCAARSMLRRYYQLILVHDFLPRVADPEVVTEMLSGPWKLYDPDESQFFMPLEFSGAAFRFGHSMIRGRYRINIYRTELLPQLFDALAEYERLPDNWVIQWENFVEGGPNKARFIDTQVAASLFIVPSPSGERIRLPVQTLLRGYMLSLPTGQAVSRALELKPEEMMSEADIEAVAARLPNGTQLSELRKERVADDGTKWKLSARTPLWFYILAEAVHSRLVLKRGQHLGPVGSRLVAGVLTALVRRSKDSVLKIPGWPPARDPKFTLSDLLRLAGAL